MNDEIKELDIKHVVVEYMSFSRDDGRLCGLLQQLQARNNAGPRNITARSHWDMLPDDLVDVVRGKAAVIKERTT